MIKQYINLLVNKQFFILKNKQQQYLFINSTIILKITKNSFFDKELNTLVYNTTVAAAAFIKNIWYYAFSKIKFTGKGFKVKKTKKQNLNFFFYHSHINILILKNVLVKKLSKNKLLILTKTDQLKKKLELQILQIKPINIYTKRGLRLSRVIIKKRTGKKAAAN